MSPTKSELEEDLASYEDDFTEVEAIASDPDLTPSEKVEAILDIVQEPDEEAEEEE